MENLKLGTQVIHAAKPSGMQGAVVTPIFQSSTFESGLAAHHDDVRYSRLSNSPNHLILGERLARVEGTAAGLVTGSGMAAITTALLATVKKGEHLIAQGDLYGGTLNFLREFFPSMGREVSFFDIDDDESYEYYARDNTRAIFVESLSNPLLKTPDLIGIVQEARACGWTSIIDNTFASPVNFRPATLGFDVVVHSATKYLNGHSDVVAGAILSTKERIKTFNHLLNDLGGCLDPHACFLLERGLKTLELRVRRQNSSALAVAQALEAHPKVQRVYYPGLASHAYHARAEYYFSGYGGMLSFVYDGDAVGTEAMLKRLKIVTVAPSLGGVESLATRPIATSHLGFPSEILEKMGIEPSLVRISVGIEAPEDLVADFLAALG